MSGGQKQRVAAARSLISNPDIILADEPTGALDTKAARLLMEKLQEVNQVQGRTILMVTHDPNAASFCSRILFIQDGVIFHELRRKVPTETREEFYARILQVGLGADDYLTKPCNIERLLARIKNLLRRKEEQIRQGLLDGNGFLLDPNTFTIYVGKSSSLMPPNEGKILLALLKKSPNLVTKHELCNVLWGTEECIDENALQVTFTRLRKTLREFGLEERIETVRGQGYRLKEQVRL